MITTYLYSRLARLDVRRLHTLSLDVLGYALMMLVAFVMVSASFLLNEPRNHGARRAPATPQATVDAVPSR